MTANNLNIGETGIIKELKIDDEIQKNELIELGFIPDALR